MTHTPASALRFVLAASALVMGVAAQALVGSGDLRWAIAPYLVAAVCFALGGYAAARLPSSRRPSDIPASTPTTSTGSTSLRGWPRDRERAIGAAAVGLSLSALIAATWGFAQGPPNTLAWYAYGASVVLLLLALPSFEKRWTALLRRANAGPLVSVGLRSLCIWGLLGLVLFLATLIRLYQLDDLPAGLWYDEADNLFHARHIQQSPGAAPVFIPSTNLPSLFLLPIAAVIELTGLTVTSGRLVSVLFGVAGVAAVFLLVRSMMGPRLAVAAAFLMAVNRWDINWSRIGMHGITAPLFAALTAYLTLRALRSGRLHDYGYAGAAMGLGMWFYSAHRLFPLVVGFMLLHHLFTKRPRLARFAAQVLVMGAVSLAVAAPVVQYAVSEPGEFFQRTGTISVFSHAPVVDALDQAVVSLGEHLMMFNYRGDPNPRHNLPGAPMLDFLSGVLLVLGIGVALARWRDVEFAVLPVWLLLMLLPGALTLPWEAPQSLRTIGALPAVVVLVTLAVGVLTRVGGAAPWHSVRAAAPAAAALMLGVIAYENVNTYFGAQAKHPEVYAAFSTDETLVGRHMSEQQRLGRSLMISRQLLHSLSISLIAGNPKTRVLRVPDGVPIDASTVSNGVSVYLEPREASVYRLLKEYYPDALYRQVRAPTGGSVLFYSAVITREELEAAHGLRAEYTRPDRSTLSEIQAASEAAWPPGPGHDDLPVGFEWTGALHVTEPGRYLLALEDDVAAEVLLDGRRILGGGERKAWVEPAVGLHAIAVVGSVQRRGSALRLLWQPPGGQLEPIPGGHLYHGAVRPLGLAGRFAPLGEGEPDPLVTHVTPAMDAFYYDPVVPEPYAAVWEGYLEIPESGSYLFELRGSGAVTLALDGVVREEGPEPRSHVAATELLEAGEHSIRVEFRSEAPPSDFELLWAPPDRPLGPIPFEALSPLPDRMFRVVEAGE